MSGAAGCYAPGLLRGRTALVTGGGTGIGRGISLAFAALGCDVAILSRRIDHLTPTVAALEACGVHAVALTADVRQPDQIATALAQLPDTFAGLDILVNGAAGNFLCAADALSPNGFGAVIDIDLKGTFNMSRAALPRLKVAGGVILNISATLQLVGTSGQVHAASAKAGIDALTRTLAVEWGPQGVRVNGLAPGLVDGTEGVARLTSDEVRQRNTVRSPLGRLATIDEVAAAAVFLCSDAARFVNGATLVVDGGLWLRSGHALGAE